MGVEHVLGLLALRDVLALGDDQFALAELANAQRYLDRHLAGTLARLGFEFEGAAFLQPGAGALGVEAGQAVVEAGVDLLVGAEPAEELGILEDDLPALGVGHGDAEAERLQQVLEELGLNDRR